MPRPTVKPTITDGEETHPAWGLIGASRVSSGRGTPLFDSDILHQHYVVVRLKRASRQRSLHNDHKHGREELVEIALSEAQWASFVSTMNIGDGVPCTIEHVSRETMPRVEHDPRLAVSMDEVGRAAEKAIEEIQAAFSAYQKKKTAENRRTLEYAIKNAPSNMSFAAKSLSEHAENVVQRARADIEAMVVSKAQQLGIDAADVADVNLLEKGGGDENPSRQD
jgi:hypothetical protein